MCFTCVITVINIFCQKYGKVDYKTVPGSGRKNSYNAHFPILIICKFFCLIFIVTTAKKCQVIKKDKQFKLLKIRKKLTA